MGNDRFLNTYGWILIGIVFVCVVSIARIDALPDNHKIFVLVISIYYLATGIGILFRKLWGYYLLKSFLYDLFLGFPIGTFIALKSLKFMKDNSIKEEFIT